MWNSISIAMHIIVTLLIFLSMMPCTIIHGQQQQQAEVMMRIDPTTATSDDASTTEMDAQAEKMHHRGHGSNNDNMEPTTATANENHEAMTQAHDTFDSDQNTEMNTDNTAMHSDTSNQNMEMNHPDAETASADEAADATAITEPDDDTTADIARQLAAARRRAEAAQTVRERRRNMAAATMATHSTSFSSSASAAQAARRQVESAQRHGRRNMAILMTIASSDENSAKNNNNIGTHLTNNDQEEEQEEIQNEGEEEVSATAAPTQADEEEQEIGYNEGMGEEETAADTESSAAAAASTDNDEEEQEIGYDEEVEEETAADTESSTSAAAAASTDDEEREEEIYDEELDEEAATNSESINDEANEGPPSDPHHHPHRDHHEQPTLINDKEEVDYDDEGGDDDNDDDDDIEKYLADFDTMLNEHDALMELLLSTNRGKIEKQEKLLDTLTADYSSLEDITAKVVEQIQQINVRQLEELRNSLKQIYNDELSRRQRIMKTATATTVDMIPEIMTVEELEPILAETLTVLKQRDEDVEKIITDIIVEKVSNGLDIPDFGELLEHDDDEEEEGEVGSSAFSVSNCVTPAEAVETIHQTLVNFSNDVIGRHDHVVTDFTRLSSSSSRGASSSSSRPQRRHGGRIVHEMTSATYIADNPQQQSQAALGESWWRQFIPEDWESFLLPVGWEEWDTRIPLWLAHTLHLGGVGGPFGAVAAPPESILQSQILPGACWPMSGATGHVTVALPYSLHVDGISIDHASRALLDKREEQAKSAPKRVRVIGYPPCRDDDNKDDDDDNSCRGLSFNPHDPLHIMDLEYDIHKTITQTFDVKLDGDEIDKTSCAADEEYGSCSSRPVFSASPLEKEDVIAAVRFEVLENWGNPDYTCLYRVRVHGKRTELEG